MSLTPIRAQGRFSGSVLSFRDISQRYALDRHEGRIHLDGEPRAAHAAHFNPRGAGLAQLRAFWAKTNEKATNLLRIALTNSDRLVRLINDILDLERIQSGREPLAFRTVQLADIVKQAIEDMQPMADAAGVQLIHDSTQVEIPPIPTACCRSLPICFRMPSSFRRRTHR